MFNSILDAMLYPVSYDFAALVVRIAVGLALLPWGLKKLFGQSAASKFPKVGPFSSVTAFYLAMIIEFTVPFFLFAGLFTRMAVIPAICSFSVATKVTKGPYFTSPASLYLLMMIAILLIGGGAYSLDHFLQTEFAH